MQKNANRTHAMQHDNFPGGRRHWAQRWGVCATRRGALLLFLTLCQRQQRGRSPAQGNGNSYAHLCSCWGLPAQKKAKPSRGSPSVFMPASAPAPTPVTAVYPPVHSMRCSWQQAPCSTSSPPSDSFGLSVHWPHYAPQSRERKKQIQKKLRKDA